MDRDPITAPKASGTQSASRSDKLNGENRTKSIDGGGANYSKQTSNVNGAPPPNNPYRK